MAKFPRSRRKQYQVQRGDTSHPWIVWGIDDGWWDEVHTFSYKYQAREWIAEEKAKKRSESRKIVR